MHQKKISSIILFILCCLHSSLFAQQANDQAANKYDVGHLNKRVGTLKIVPFFLKKSKQFWFRAEEVQRSGDTLSEKKATQYYLVDLTNGHKRKLFDQQVIIGKLAALTGNKVESDKISYSPDFSADEKSVLVRYASKSYQYNYTTKQLTKSVDSARKLKNYPKVGASVDGKYELYTRAHNLYIRNASNGENEVQLSSNAAPYYSFCVDEKGDYTNDKTFPSIAKWIDARYFYALRTDKRKVLTMSVISSAFTPRPLVSTYKYELPGDKDVAQFELFIGDAQQGTLKKVAMEHWPDQQLEVVPSTGNTKELFVLRRKRTRDEMELCAVNLQDGKVRTIIHEVSKPFINEDFFNVSIINAGTEIIWWSDRSGWGQYYRYNAEGKLLNRITNGNFTAGKINAIDTAKGIVYLYAYGKQASINPYYAHLYQVGLDGKNERLLTPENATHQVFISPDRKYMVDTYSRIDLAPVTKLRKIDGQQVAQVFKADTDLLYAYGWKHAEAFTVKAKDGVTDLYGLIWKPFDFDPNKKYPVIAQVYPGPQIETVWNDFTVLDKYNNTALAQLGFIVVAVGHRGGSPIRNAEYYKYGYANLRDNGIDDNKYALEQLGTRFAYLDLNKVGIFGHSGGGMMTVAAMCSYPDFYRVGVASSGNHDNRIYQRNWGEAYQGFEKKMAINQDLAKNLKGHLMLVTGEVDENVNPANTYRMADALIKADKDFDLMVLPGQSHSYEGAAKSYFQKRLRAYFAKYLLEQPK